DFLEVGPDGRLYASQSNQVDVLFPITQPRVIASSPIQGQGITPIVNAASITFDVGMSSLDSTATASVTNLANYKLLNLDTGLSVPISAVAYDASNRTARMAFESLAPNQYRLSVSRSVQSEVGVSLGDEFATT